MYQTAVAGTRRTGVENLAEDADDVFFSRFLHNENHVSTPLFLPESLERNDLCYELRRCRHERRLTMPNVTSFTDRPSYELFHQTTFYCLIAICQFIIPGKRIHIRYVVKSVLMKTHKCVLQL